MYLIHRCGPQIQIQIFLDLTPSFRKPGAPAAPYAEPPGQGRFAELEISSTSNTCYVDLETYNPLIRPRLANI